MTSSPPPPLETPSPPLTDANGNPIPNQFRIKKGQDFQLRVLVQDLRGARATGVFAGYLDIDYSTDNGLPFDIIYGETQRITISNNALGGTFTLTFEGNTTAPISIEQSGANIANDIQAALEGLPTLQPGDVEVRNTPFSDPSDPANSNPFIFTVRFVGSRRRQDVPLMSIDTSGLTPQGDVTGNVEELFPADITNPGTFRSSFITGPLYPNGLSAKAGVNQFDEVGSFFQGFVHPDPTGQSLLVYVGLEATQRGRVTFSGSPADEPGSEVLIFGSNDPVPTNLVDYGEPITILVEQPVNAEDDFYGTGGTAEPLQILEDSVSVVLDVLANDFLEQGSTGSLALDPNGLGIPSQGGTITVVNNQILYTPAPDFFGVETFTYTAIDGLGNSDTATVTVTVDPVNDPPDAVDDSFSVDEDSSGNVLQPLANDNAGPANEDQTLTIIAVGAPDQGGSVQISADGQTLSYTPLPDFFGQETFTYTIQDSEGLTDTATITVTVNNVNDPPTANDDAFTVQEDSSNNALDVLANDTIAPDAGETLTITSVGTPSAGGTATISGNRILYTPAADFFGQETFTYAIDDGNGGVDEATVTVTVQNVNDPPVAQDDLFFVDEFSQDNFLDVLANDTFLPDPPETLTVTAISQPANGNASIAPGGNGILYTPANQLAPFDDTFTYQISDGNGGTAEATVTVHVEPVVRPRARNDRFTVQEDSAGNVLDVMANDLFNEGATRSLTRIVTPPSHGTAQISDNGTPDDPTDDVILYTPDPDFFGTDTLEYEVDDDFVDPENDPSAPDTALVTITVVNVNDPPTVLDDTFDVLEDSTNNILDVLANDSFLPDPPETLSITGVGASAVGATIEVSGSVLRYTPPADFFGQDVFTYTVSDGNGGESVGQVTVNVQNVNDPPTANPDRFIVDEDSQNNLLPVLDNDTIAPDEGEVLTISSVGTAQHGSATLQNNQIFYTPNPDFFGVDTFTYTIDDGNGGTATTTVTVEVQNVNDPPDAVDDAFIAVKNFVDQELNVLANDTFLPDPPETLTIVAIGPSAVGATVTTNGSVIFYTPPADFEGEDSFTYTIDDGNGGQDTAQVTVNVVDAIPVDITGRAYFDSNNNGRYDQGETLLADVEVTLEGINIRGETVRRTVRTGPDGTYVFEDVLPNSLDAGSTYLITGAQPRYTLDGAESIGSHGGTQPANDQLAVRVDLFQVLQEFQQTQQIPVFSGYNFGERGVRPEFITLAELLASSTRNGLIVATNLAGEQFWHAILQGWNHATRAEIVLAHDLTSATLKVWDKAGTVHTRTIPTAGNRHFRIMGHDGNGGYVVRIDGTAEQLGFNLLARSEDSRAEGEHAEAAQQEAEAYAAAVDRIFGQWA